MTLIDVSVRQQLAAALRESDSLLAALPTLVALCDADALRPPPLFGSALATPAVRQANARIAHCRLAECVCFALGCVCRARGLSTLAASHAHARHCSKCAGV